MPELGRTTPCAECPWRTASRRGYLGADNPVHFYWQSVTAESLMPCHEQIDYEDPGWISNQLPLADLCAGNLIHFRNSLKAPRRPELAAAVAAVKASKAVFTWPWDFLAHHMPRATAAEVRTAVSRTLLPGVEPEE